MQHVQVLRAAAVLLVVADHAGFDTLGGFVGVDVFFVISGFVFAGSLRREYAASAALDLGAFARRRVAATAACARRNEGALGPAPRPLSVRLPPIEREHATETSSRTGWPVMAWPRGRPFMAAPAWR